MPLIIFPTSQLLWVRVAALLFTCVAFSVAAHGANVDGGMADWCIFCWAFSFACTLLVLLVEQFGLQARAPVSWSNFPITIACYATLLCLSASVIFPLYFLKYQQHGSDAARDHRIVSTVFSCLATVAYMGEVSLSRARPGEVAGYMATAPGLLKVCQTFVACVIFILVSNPVLYDSHAALKWCMAVYCICFILSMAVVVLCVGECTGCLPIPFSKFLSAYGLLAVIMYLTATIIWPVFQFDKQYHGRSYGSSNLITVAVLTALNFLLYLADLAYTARLVFVTV
ncbi:myeloid-associated differentiation marker homolog [Seriola lalandi dorsalis]|uniref:Myeloid associated differentiation marker n=1 Tax=Seriola lalandi dorsalis TaxID=1841481 RepID=A0A3B4WRY1_SERLL|nr:myeloid-associated differentiation marker homolog [Seriola lalandi dorsalis]XP_023271089.1 myeloid-associated differentiation marker homolog [Seriola lalandi dorsalis]